MPRILVTNDDGIDSVGLHVLAREAATLGDVVVVAPDSEYSGASMALGPLHLIEPEVRRTTIDGVAEVWTVSGPPALCVYCAVLGAFGDPFDLVLAGINPGANVGRSVHHSGTVGAALTAVSAGVSAVAVSQSVPGPTVEGQAIDLDPSEQLWDSAARAGIVVARSLLRNPPAQPLAVNVNVPNQPLDGIAGWRDTHLAAGPGRAVGDAILVPHDDTDGSFTVKLGWSGVRDHPPETDGGTIREGFVSVSVLTRLVGHDPTFDVPGAADLTLLLGGGAESY